MGFFRRRETADLQPVATEKRTDSYTDALVSIIQSRANGKRLSVPDAAASIEMASGLVQRAFQSAKVGKASDSIIRALTPEFLGALGRALIRRGEMVAAIEVEDGELILYPGIIHSVIGDYKESSWVYKINISGPSVIVTKDLSSSRVLHFKYAVDAGRMWRGVGPMQAATLAAELTGSSSGSLSKEAGSTIGSVLPMPKTDGADDTVDLLKSDLGSLNGEMALVESMAQNWGAGGTAGLNSEWTQRRIGPNPPLSMIELQKLATAEVLGACGIPPAIFSPGGDAQTTREAWRQMLGALVRPCADLVESELRRKLDSPDLRLTFAELQATDIQARARSFKSLIDGGMSIQDAAGTSGILLD